MVSLHDEIVSLIDRLAGAPAVTPKDEISTEVHALIGAAFAEQDEKDKERDAKIAEVAATLAEIKTGIEDGLNHLNPDTPMEDGGVNGTNLGGATDVLNTTLGAANSAASILSWITPPAASPEAGEGDSSE